MEQLERTLEFVKPNMSGAYLREVRRLRGETLADAARHIGCSQSTLKRIERDGISWRTRLRTLVHICGYYRISADHIGALIDLPAA